MNKLCVDCKWFERKFWIPFSLRRCYSPLASRTDVVANKPPFADIERVFGNCLIDGKLWEKR